MPRNAAGVYTLPNAPVVSGTTITSVDENTTRSDMETELTNSLDRNGRGNMLAPFKAFDGTQGAPGITFGSDTDNGLFRIGVNTIGFAIGGALALTIAGGGLDVEGGLVVGGGNTVTSPAPGVVYISRAANPVIEFQTAGAVDAQIRVIAADSLSFTTDGSTAEQFRVGHTAAAVNYVLARGAATAGQPRIEVQGTDGSISFNYITKGTGSHQFFTAAGADMQVRIAPIASAANYVTIHGRATLAAPVIGTNGSDTNIALAYGVKGNASHGFYTGTTWNADGSVNAAIEQFRISHTASAVNLIQVTGAATGGTVSISAIGTDTDVGLQLTSKGSDSISLYTQNFASISARFVAPVSSVNFITLQGAIAGSYPSLDTTNSSDADTGIIIATKGAGYIALRTNNIDQVRIGHTASANRHITLTGSNGGNPTIGTSAGDLAFGGNIALPALANLYLDGGSDTYIEEASADLIQFVTGGTARAAMSSSGFGIVDTGNNHYLFLKPGSDLSANRTLTITTGDANRTLTINADTTLNGGVAAWTLGTPVASTSGTSIDFTGIPAGTKIIVINFVGVSMNGAANMIVQIGDSGGVEAAGYLGAETSFGGATLATTNLGGSGFGCDSAMGATVVAHGQVVLRLENSAAFTWTATSNIAHSNGTALVISAGSKSLSAELDRVRITTVAGTATFDAGEINIQYM